MSRNVAHVFDIIRDVTDDELLNAWNELHEAAPPGWFAGRPSFDERRDEWSRYAFDTSKRLKLGHRSGEWTALTPTPARVAAR